MSKITHAIIHTFGESKKVALASSIEKAELYAAQVGVEDGLFDTVEDGLAHFNTDNEAYDRDLSIEIYETVTLA